MNAYSGVKFSRGKLALTLSPGVRIISAPLPSEQELAWTYRINNDAARTKAEMDFIASMG
jgi:hypothetical protein